MKRLRFSHKLVIVSALASVVVWLVFGAAFLYVSQSTLTRQLTGFEATLATNLMSEMDRSLFHARQDIQVIAQDQLVRQGLYAHENPAADGQQSSGASGRAQRKLAEHLERLSLLTGPWHVVSVVHHDGDLVASNMPGTAQPGLLQHPAKEAAIESALDNEVYSSELRLIGDDREPSLLFAAPVMGLDGASNRVVGAVIAQYGWPALNQMLDGIDPRIDAQLLRSDGTVIATRPRQRERIGTQAAEWSTLASLDLSQGPRAVQGPAQKGEPDSLLVAARQRGHLGYSGNDWLVALEVPYTLLLNPVYEMVGQLALIGLLAIAALCAVLYAVTSYLTRPIGHMSKAVDAFSEGDMSTRVRVQSNDELADLAQAFNRMARDIGYYIEEVRENNREVRSFAYIVSHDLRSPLVNLQGFSSEISHSLAELETALEPAWPLLSEKNRLQAREILDEDIPEALQFINSSVSRMDNQIQSVLKLSRLGRRELKYDPVDAQALVQEVLDSLHHQLESKQVSVHTATLPVVEADAFGLEQIFSNLIDNAVKYLDEPPGRIDIWSTEGDETVTFHIRDNGPGIDPVNVERVFELFRRVGRTDVAGDGMGLAYVKALVRRHGGRIGCESTLGEGTCFSFSLSKHPSVQVRELD